MYNHTVCDVTYLFPVGSYSEKSVENTASDGFGWNFARTVYERITTFYTLIEDNLSHKTTGYDVTSCFRSAFIEVRKIAKNASSDGFVSTESNALSKASSNFSSEEYRQLFELSGVAWRFV